MDAKLRVVIADDERPARMFLRAILEGFEDVELVGEAESGLEAVELIESVRPDLALLDLQMPEATGLDVVKLLEGDSLPLVAFVTAYDEYAVQAFEINAIDYLLKPIERARLRETLNRAQDLLEKPGARESEISNLRAAACEAADISRAAFLERIPLRRRDEIIIVPVGEIASIVADAELLHITTIGKERFTINYRLKDIEARLDRAKFIRLSRGTLVNLEMITKIIPLPGGTYSVSLKNSQKLTSSRMQSRVLRAEFLRL